MEAARPLGAVGNIGATRAACIGISSSTDLEILMLARDQTIVTHSDPRSYAG